MGRTKPATVRGIPAFKRKVVYIDWPDYGIPCLNRPDWTVIARALLAMKKPIHVHCLMGHGRTGTALSILLHMWGVIPPATCPVTWVRAHYCDDAVENREQLVYVENITGEKVTAKPVWSPPVTTNFPLPPATIGYPKPYNWDEGDTDLYGGINLSPTVTKPSRKEKKRARKNYKQSLEKWGI